MAIRLGDPVEKSYGGSRRDDINDRYHRYDKILGRGAYKTVYWGWDTAEGVDVAWNCIDLDMLPSTEERSKILREVEMLQQLNHKHILRIRDHWDNPKTNQLCFITDILQGGSLREYIRQREVNLLRVKSWCVQILDALQYLHNSSPVIIHRDLKCDNIFIDGPSGNITIGDLGLSTKYADSLINSNEKGMSIVGTPEFMAPELYEEQYDEKVDIYSFGMCILEMISKKYPYEECTNQIQVIRKVTDKKQPDILRRLHRYVRTFIEICIERNPRRRPSAVELLKHPFLSFMDDLKNRWSVSDFVFEEDRTVMHYKEMENKTRYKQQQRQLSMIKESQGERENVRTANSKSPSPKTNNTNTIKRAMKGTKKGRTKKKYVSGTTVSVEDAGKISVKLKIHHDKESQKVKFQFDPQTEHIQSVVREMVETLQLDRSRETEIVNAIKSRLNELETLPQDAIATQTQHTHSPSLQIGCTGATQTQSVFPKVFNANGTTAHLLPNGMNNTSNKAMPITHAAMNKRRASPNSNTPNSIMNSNTNKSTNMIKTTQSAPVSPGHSAQNDKINVINTSKVKAQTGYTSDNASEVVQDKNAPKLVSDSLLDQIMALPRETIKARIVQFGGTFNDEDNTGILVTKLFKLLSDNTNNKNNNKGKQTQNEVEIATTEDEHTPALIMQHTMMAHSDHNHTGNIQHIGASNNVQQHLSNLNAVKINGASYHGTSTSDITSNMQSIHCSPPDIINPSQQRNNSHISSITYIESPPNELVYASLKLASLSTTRQASNESVKSGYSPVSSVQTQSAISPRGMTSHHRQLMQQPMVTHMIDNGNDEEEIDPNIELPKLRLRKKELMKGKIVNEMERMKQRNCAQLGRDKTIDNIASELAEVEKQIKILTDASKNGTKIMQKKHNKTPTDSNINIQKDDKDDRDKRTMHSRSNSAESLKDKARKEGQGQVQLNVDHHSIMGSASNSESHSFSMLPDIGDDAVKNIISSPLVSTTHRDQFESHLQRLPHTLDLSEIVFNLDNAFNLHENKVSFQVFQNAKDRITREKKQLEEEYNQYYEDQTEMLLLKLQKHSHNHNKLMSETQSTQNKLLSKQEKQRNKFKSTVDDKLQILQLTHILNDDNTSTGTGTTAVPHDEFYLYKQAIDKVYLERVKQFEDKQKKEFVSFRKEMRELNHLKLEIRKKQQMLNVASNPSSPKQIRINRRTLPHTQSLSSSAVQIDILTGLDLNDDPPSLIQHCHSSSLPLIDTTKILHNHSNNAMPSNVSHPPQSKFKVSRISNPNPHPHTMMHSQLQHHNHTSTPPQHQHHSSTNIHQLQQHIHSHSHSHSARTNFNHSLNNSFDNNNNHKS